ncbi:MAG TPA: hypothetical protein VHM70_28310, partial [Polyangiaceae bacterium]|nr:hypothetical protein [Polyangiaceae bacterium]
CPDQTPLQEGSHPKLIRMFTGELHRPATRFSPVNFTEYPRFVAPANREVLDDFQRYKLTLFHETKKHMYFNVFRYDTERAFYDQIENVRGTKPRNDYWEEILERLAQTVADVRASRREDGSADLNKLVSIVTLLGAFQLVFTVVPMLVELSGKFHDKKLGPSDMVPLGELAAFVLATVLGLVWLSWRRKT